MLLTSAPEFSINPSARTKLPYDPLRDFTFISQLTSGQFLLVSHPSVPVRTVKELVALAKARPGDLSYATSGPGGTGHMATELFSRQVGIKMLHVPYKGNSQALVDVIGGQVMLMFDQVSTSEPHIKAGKLRGLAVSSRTRSPLFPNLPTIDEAGVPGFEDITFNGLVAPAGTPRELRLRIQQEVAKAVGTAKLRERFIERGVELRASASPEEFAAHIKTEFDKKAKLAKEANIRID
jgi:tripartite-type tricarboxylate transporter receptor subunit TctC